MLARRLVFFSLIVVMVSLFNNCDNNFTVMQMKNNKLGSSGDACLDQLKTVYSTTYWPFLRQTCGACHGDKHGSSNVTTSFTSFMTYGAGLIDFQSTTAHGGNALGPQYQPQIDAFKPQWTDANDDYLVCKAQQQQNNPGGSTVIDLPLAPKVVPNLATTAANVNTYVPLTYNVATEVASNNQMNILAGTFRIEVKLWVASGATIGLIFRNPSFQPTNGSPPFVLSGLSVALNNVDQSQFFTTYKTLGSFNTGIPIPAGTTGLAAIPLAPNFGGAPIAFPPVNTTVTVGIILKNLILNGVVAPPPGATPTPSPTPPPVAGLTYTQLVAPGGLFAVNCVGCHNAANMSGNLNLTTYAGAFAARAQIANRVTSAAAPMPTTGLLPAAQQAQITAWVNDGAPQ